MIIMDILTLPWIQEEQLSATGEKIERTQSIGKLRQLGLPCNSVNNWPCLI